MRLQLRVEMFNAFNHARFNDFNRSAQFNTAGQLINTPGALGGTGGRFGFAALWGRWIRGESNSRPSFTSEPRVEGRRSQHLPSIGILSGEWCATYSSGSGWPLFAESVDRAAKPSKQAIWSAPSEASANT